MMRQLSLTVAAVAALLSAVPAAAQGNGNGNAYGHFKNNGGGAVAAVPSAAGSPEIQVSGTGTRNFGSWLDDASVLSPGDTFVSVGIGLWNMPGYREVNVPMVDASVGVGRRVQVSGSMPYFYANEPGGPVARGFGTSYLAAKLQLRAARPGHVGFAVTPVLELLTTAPLDGVSRRGWALPLNIEYQGRGWRTFSSVGYFSRGAIFASGAVEAAIGSRAWVTGSVSSSHSTRADPLSFALGLSKTRVDATGGVSMALTNRASLYGSVGRTISRADANSATLALAGGVAFQLPRVP